MLAEALSSFNISLWRKLDPLLRRWQAVLSRWNLEHSVILRIRSDSPQRIRNGCKLLNETTRKEFDNRDVAPGNLISSVWGLLAALMCLQYWTPLWTIKYLHLANTIVFATAISYQRSEPPSSGTSGNALE